MKTTIKDLTAEEAAKRVKAGPTAGWALVVASSKFWKGYSRLYHSKGELKARWIEACRHNIPEAVRMLQEFDEGQSVGCFDDNREGTKAIA